MSMTERGQGVQENTEGGECRGRGEEALLCLSMLKKAMKNKRALKWGRREMFEYLVENDGCEVFWGEVNVTNRMKGEGRKGGSRIVK